MPWKQWFGPGRRLMAVFLVVAVILAGTVLWLGWQLARQDREVAAQRLQEHRENAADLAVAALQKSFSQADEQLTVIAALPLPECRRKAAEFTRALPSDSVLVLERNGEIEAWPETRLAFYPAVQAAASPPAHAILRSRCNRVPTGGLCAGFVGPREDCALDRSGDARRGATPHGADLSQAGAMG